MKVLFLGGPFDGRRDEWDATMSVMYVEHYHGKTMVMRDETKEFQSVRYDLQRFNTGPGFELLVAVAADVRDVLGDLIRNYKAPGPISDRARAIIIQSARGEWHHSGATFEDTINHVIDDARNAR